MEMVGIRNPFNISHTVKAQSRLIIIVECDQVECDLKVFLNVYACR